MTHQIPPSTLLAALLAAAFVLLAPSAQATAVPLFGSETTVVIAPGRPIVNGGAGQFSSQGQTTAVVLGSWANATGSASLEDGALHATAIGGGFDCVQYWQHCPPFYYGHQPVPVAGTTLKLWDMGWTSNMTGSSQLITGWLGVEGTFEGGAWGRYRYHWGRHYSDPRENLGYYAPWHALSSGTTEIDWDIPIPPGESDTPIWIYLELDIVAPMNGNGGSRADFGHTMRFNWDLPDGVTFRSASGHFMTGGVGAVPEPRSGALALAGLALLGAARFARRRAAD